MAWVIRSAGQTFGAFGAIALFMATIGLYGVKVPFRLQQWIDGKRSEETVFTHAKINATLDRKTFQASEDRDNRQRCGGIMFNRTSWLFVVALVLGAASVSSGQSVIVSGKWTLNIEKSDYRTVTPYLPQQTLDILHDERTLTIKTTTATRQASEVVEKKYTTDKREGINAGKGIKDLKSTCWIENGTIHIEGEQEGVSVTASSSGGDPQPENYEYFRYHCSEQLSLSPDANTLTIARTLEMPDGKRRITLVFERAKGR